MLTYSKATMKGNAAEHLFVSRCYLEGFYALRVDSSDLPYDVLVASNSKFVRCQIKQVRSKGKGYGIDTCGARPTGKLRKKGKALRRHYTRKSIDFLVGVELSSGKVYIVPVKDTMLFKTWMSLKNLKTGNYLERFDLLKGPKHGNSTSGTPTNQSREGKSCRSSANND
jgi:hypothetical protein